MSFSVARSFAGLTLRLARSGKQCPGVLGINRIAAGTTSQPDVGYRGFRRSLWILGSQTKLLSSQSDVPTWSTRCGCCGLHTEGDKKIADFLKKEIQAEKDSNPEDGQVPGLSNFQISAEDALVTLTTSNGNETLTLRLNVNNSVSSAPGPDEEEGEMYCAPDFTVELNKGGETSLLMQCTLDVDSFNEEDMQEQPSDDFQILEVAVVKKGEDWSDSTYRMSTEVMDPEMTSILTEMLEERLGDKFADDLVRFSTAYEHKKYIGFLENVRDFATSGKN